MIYANQNSDFSTPNFRGTFSEMLQTQIMETDDAGARPERYVNVK